MNSKTRREILIICSVLIAGLVVNAVFAYITNNNDKNIQDCDTFIYGPFCDPFFEMDREFVPIGDVINTGSLVVILPYNGQHVDTAMVIGIADTAYDGIYNARTTERDITVNSAWLIDSGVDFGTVYWVEHDSSLYKDRYKQDYIFYDAPSGTHRGTIYSVSPFECNVTPNGDYTWCGVESFYGEVIDATKTERGINITIDAVNRSDVVIELT